MRKIITLTSLILAMTIVSCNNTKNKPISTDDNTQKTLLSQDDNSDKLYFFNAKMIDCPKSSLGISENMIYDYATDWEYDSKYSSILQPDIPLNFNPEFGFIWNIVNANNNIYIYGSDKQDEDRLCVFDNSLSEFREILKDGNCYKKRSLTSTYLIFRKK